MPGHNPALMIPLLLPLKVTSGVEFSRVVLGSKRHTLSSFPENMQVLWKAQSLAIVSTIIVFPFKETLHVQTEGKNPSVALTWVVVWVLAFSAGN